MPPILINFSTFQLDIVILFMNQSTVSHPPTESGGSPSVFLSTSCSLFLFHVHIYTSNFILNHTSSNCQFPPLPLLQFQSPHPGTRSVAILRHPSPTALPLQFPFLPLIPLSQPPTSAGFPWEVPATQAREAVG